MSDREIQGHIVCNKMEDTVTLARQEREKQGSWEVEVSYGGEADLHRHLASCDKNPGHQNFFPVNQFNVGHLPAGCQDNDIVDMVRALSDITVRLSVRYVSDSRPETVPGSDEPFPQYKGGGRNRTRVGTGWVKCVVRNQKKYKYEIVKSRCEKCVNSPTSESCECEKIVKLPLLEPCECKECVNSSTPKTQFAYIHIRTAAHVVFDNLEAAHTTCDLFFDKGGTPKLCPGVFTLNGMLEVNVKLDGDWCEMIFVTHDLEMADRLDKAVQSYANLRNRVMDKHDHLIAERQSPRHTEEPEPDPWDSLIIIVSHPHGCSKQVSVGRYSQREETDNGWIRYTYTTATCPGSSGAHVCVLEKGFSSKLDVSAHSGGGQEFNYCGYGLSTHK